MVICQIHDIIESMHFFPLPTFAPHYRNSDYMRLIAVILMFTLSAVAMAQRPVDTFFDQADNFFKRNVSAGLVDYTLIKNDPVKLNELVSLISEVNQEELAVDDRKAFLINAYNILVIDGICKEYPVNSVMDIDGFFKKKKHAWYGGTITLDDIEFKLLQPSTDDRLHFALVCAAKTCPPLMEGAYLPANIDKQLTAARYQTLNDASWIIIDNPNTQILFPELLEWYEHDFTGEKMEIRDYVNLYRKHALDMDYDFEDTYYDWTLNDSKLAGKFAMPQFPPGKGQYVPPGDETTTGTNSNKNKRKGNDEGASNVRTYTPSVLLKKDQVEVKLFNNLYTQTAWFNSDGDHTPTGGRDNYHTTLLQVLLGTTESARVNWGIDVNLKGTRSDTASDASPLNVFKFEDNATNRWELASVGAKVKFAPFKELKRLSVQSTLWIPVANDLEGTPWLDWNRLTWWNQFFFDKPIGEHFQIFTEADVMVRIPRDQNTGLQFFMPVSLFTSYFPTNKSTVYGMFQYAPTQQYDPEFKNAAGAYYMQYGVGTKYQVTKSLEVEFLFTDFFTGVAQGAGETYNIGIRYLR